MPQSADKTGRTGQRRLKAAAESWPISGAFTIARGSKREARVVLVAITEDGCTGRGECVPYARYDETVDGTVAAISACAGAIAEGASRQDLLTLLPAGAARNALDCALWDLEAKLSGVPAAEAAACAPLRVVETAYTISLAAPEEMAAAAKAVAAYPLLKLKLGRADDEARILAVRAAVPSARLIADANEGWSADDLPRLLGVAAEAGIELVEQPLPADADCVLADVRHAVPICADESAHDRSSLEPLAGRYDAVNIKLDKTGGLTEALATAERARALGFKIMVGCMVATSLAMAPALLLAQGADYVDLDGPLLLARDREPGLTYEAGLIVPPSPALWG